MLLSSTIFGEMSSMSPEMLYLQFVIIGKPL